MERNNIVLDSETVRLAVNGDKAAFDMVYRAYRDKIYYYIIKLGAKPQDAEDIVSDTFLEAMKHIGELKNEDGLSAWLHTIAKNKFFAMGRKESRHQRVELLADDEEDGVNDGLELAVKHSAELNDDLIMLPEDYAESEETKEILAGMINSLNESQREAVYLFYHRDKTLEQISQLTGASVNTVKSRIHQAKNHLRRKISELQKSGVVLSAAPVSAMFKAVDGRVKVRANLTAPKVFSGLSTKIVAAACAIVVGGTGIMLMNSIKNEQTVVDHKSMDIRPDSSYTDTDSSRPEKKKQLSDESSEDESISMKQDVSETEEKTDDRSQDSVKDSVVSRNGSSYDIYTPNNTNIVPDDGSQRETPEPTGIISTLPLLKMGSDNNAFMAKAGDVIKYDIGYSSEKDTIGMQFSFDLPKGLEYVGFIPDNNVMQNTMGFDSYECVYNHPKEEKESMFGKQPDVMFVGSNYSYTEKAHTVKDKLKIGSILLRLSDDANEDNININFSDITSNYYDEQLNVRSSNDFTLEMSPVSKADQNDLDAAKQEEMDAITRDQELYDSLMDDLTTDEEYFYTY